MWNSFKKFLKPGDAAAGHASAPAATPNGKRPSGTGISTSAPPTNSNDNNQKPVSVVAGAGADAGKSSTPAASRGRPNLSVSIPPDTALANLQPVAVPAAVPVVSNYSPQSPFSPKEDSAALIIQRQVRRQRDKKNAVLEQHWKLFAELDTHSEAEMVHLARFFQALIDSVPEVGSSAASEPMSALEDQRLSGSGSEYLRLENITVEDTTQAIHGEVDNYNINKAPLTPKVLEEIVEVYRRRGKLHKDTVMKILRSAYRLLKEFGSVMHMAIAGQEKCTVVGDLHGNIDDLLHIFDESGMPSVHNKYIFNGDFVDRGEYSVEVITLLFCSLVVSPGNVILNRGNHEDSNICRVYGFQSECLGKYDDLVYGMFVEVFRYLPLISIVNEKIMVVHGGLFSIPNVTIDDIAEIDRTNYICKPDVDYPENTIGLSPGGARKELLCQLQREALWSDPNIASGTSLSPRGVGVFFGPDVAAKFMKDNDIAMIVRSHECVRDGFELPYAPHSLGALASPVSRGGTFMFGKSPTAVKQSSSRTLDDSLPPLLAYSQQPIDFPLLCTLFSSSNYSGGDNYAAYMVILPHVNHSSSPVGTSGMYFSIHRYRTSTSSVNGANDGLANKNKLSLRELVRSKYAALKVAFDALDETASGMVTRLQWAETLLEVTRIRIRWLALIDVLVPADCLTPKTVEYVKFLNQMIESSVSEGEDAESGRVKDLYGPRKRLEAIFNFFDDNKDGVITREEFQKGCEVLNTTMKDAEFKLTNIDHVMDLMDIDHSGSITLNELFEVFRLLDAADGKVDGEISLAKK